MVDYCIVSVQQPGEQNWYPYITSSKLRNLTIIIEIQNIGPDVRCIPTWTPFAQPCYESFSLPNSAMDGNLLVTADPERPEDAINQLASFRKLEYKQPANFSFLALPISKTFYCSLPFPPWDLSKEKKFDLKKNKKKITRRPPHQKCMISLYLTV